MSIELLSFVLGGFLVAVGLLGGGIEVRELKVPSVGRITRVLSFAAGLAFVGLAVFLGPGQVKQSAAVNAEPAALVRVTFWYPYGASSKVVSSVSGEVRATASSAIRLDHNASKDPIQAFGACCHVISAISVDLSIALCRRTGTRRFGRLWNRLRAESKD
jgi:hypothetical protein